jgi:hypothetical protein
LLDGQAMDQEPEELGRGRVDPVQILDDDDDRAAHSPGFGKQGRGGLEQLQSPRLVRGSAGRRTLVEQISQDRVPAEERRDVGLTADCCTGFPDEVGDRQVRQSRFAQVDTLRAQHHSVLDRRILQQGANESARPSASFRRDQDDAGRSVCGSRDCLPEELELRRATDEWYVALEARHGGIIAPPAGARRAFLPHATQHGTSPQVAEWTT